MDPKFIQKWSKCGHQHCVINVVVSKRPPSNPKKVSNFKTANKHLENGHQATGILWSKNGHQAATKMVF